MNTCVLGYRADSYEVRISINSPAYAANGSWHHQAQPAAALVHSKTRKGR